MQHDGNNALDRSTYKNTIENYNNAIIEAKLKYFD